MSSEEIRKSFLEFFKKKGHTIVPSSSLIPDDPSVLLTTAGVQQFKPYYFQLDPETTIHPSLGKPVGKNAISIQKCFRTSDIDAVGDESHLTFFEMLGNFSFGGYFKEKAIEYAYEYITKELGLKIDYVSIFGGDKENDIPPDEESEKIWKKIHSNIEIKKAGREDNFWGPTGNEGPCGPTTEIYIKDTEVWNIVFNEYYKDKEGKFAKLKTPGVDTGMGLERLAMVVQGKNNIFETDLFAPIMTAILSIVGDKPIGKIRITADHLKGAAFLTADGIEPSNTGRGYILRRLIRRAMLTHYRNIGVGIDINFYKKPVEELINIYSQVKQYRNLAEKKEKILETMGKETEKFGKTLERGLKEFEKGEDAFILFTTYGFPLELTQEMAREKGREIDVDRFNAQLKAHQQLSRTASVGMFKGGLVDTSEETVKLHTAAHVLMESLRRVLGNHVMQKGSNINAERLRLDFSHPEKITAEQIKQVEDMVNEKIKENLAVVCKEMSLEEAKAKNAIGVFEHKYGEWVKVYIINDFSREICGGPHVKSTGELGHFKIIKEEASSSGVRRIKAVLN